VAFRKQLLPRLTRPQPASVGLHQCADSFTAWACCRTGGEWQAALRRGRARRHELSGVLRALSCCAAAGNMAPGFVCMPCSRPTHQVTPPRPPTASSRPSVRCWFHLSAAADVALGGCAATMAARGCPLGRAPPAERLQVHDCCLSHHARGCGLEARQALGVLCAAVSDEAVAVLLSLCTFFCGTVTATYFTVSRGWTAIDARLLLGEDMPCRAGVTASDARL
jgi:hypothetical protein